MAKITAPLFSESARGKFGGIVFNHRKGVPVARKLVTPSNPQTQSQMNVRNRMAIMGAVQKFVNGNLLVDVAQTLTDLELFKSVTPVGKTWNYVLVQTGIGVGGLKYIAAEAAWIAAGPTIQTAYAAAEGLALPAIPPVPLRSAGGVVMGSHDAGFVLWMLFTAKSNAGLGTPAVDTTPLYA